MKKCFLLTALLAASTLVSAQVVSIRDNNATVDKWQSGTEAGVYVIKDGKQVTTNVKASLTDAEKGIFSAKLRGVSNGKEQRMFIYAPYDQNIVMTPEGKVKLEIPAEQNGKFAPVNFGSAKFTSLKSKSLECDMAARTTCFLIKLSSKNEMLKDWRLEKITVVAEGSKLTGDAYMETEKGAITPDPEGKSFDYVSYVPDQETFVGKEYMMVPLRVIPSGDLRGLKMRIDYTFSKDGKQMVICHDVVGLAIFESYTYTLEERIPATIAGCWHMADYPGENWESVAPEEMGYSSAKLEELRKYIQEKLTTTSMMIIVGGKVIFTMGDLEEPVRIASCRKSLLSMLYGKYVENGTVDLDATLESLGIDDKGGLLPIEKQATIRNLLTARSGVYHPASNDGDDTKYAPARGSVQPGTYHLYNNWDFNCAGGVFEKLTGKDIYDAFLEDIAIPVGMQDYKVDYQHKTGITDPTMSNFLAYHFWLSTRDMARIAYLMLHKGNWNGTQVISEDWVNLTTKPFTKRMEMNPQGRHEREFEYGYLWWTFCKEYEGYIPEVYENGFTATGSGGQYITVLPALDMVIAHKDKSQRSSKSKYYKLLAKIAACKE